MNSYQQIFGLPENKDTELIKHDSLYGFAYYSPALEFWGYYVGSFPYLFGIFQTVTSLNYAEDLYNRNLMSAYTFIQLDENHQPIKLIGCALLDPIMTTRVGWQTIIEGKPRNMVLPDLSNPGCGDIPSMKFEL